MEEYFETVKNRHNFYRTIVITCICLMFLTIIGALVYSYLLQEKFAKSTWVSVHGKVYKAELKDNFNYRDRALEVRMAIKEYYINRYSADRYSYKQNIANAIELCGECSKKVYIEYQDEEMEKSILEKGWVYFASVDSIIPSQDGYSGYIFGKQLIRTKARKLYRNIYLKYKGMPLNNRDEKNPLGILFNEIELFNNKVISNELVK